MQLGILLTGFLAGLLVGGYTIFRFAVFRWNRSVSLLTCATCHRFMGRDGRPLDGTNAYISADGLMMSGVPVDGYQGQIRDVHKFATAHGWRIQNRPVVRHLCPDCQGRERAFTDRHVAPAGPGIALDYEDGDSRDSAPAAKQKEGSAAC
jgi:hypothetical protein